MPDVIKTLSSQLAQDPDSLLFLRLGDLLRQRGQLDAAHRVALNGLERHPHLADAHDLYARILADKRDYERAFDEWDMARRIAPGHMGALKGLAFLYFKVGDVAEAVAHLEEAERVAPDDFTIQQALAMVRGQPMGSAAARPAGHAAALRPDAPPPPPVPEEPMAPPAGPLEDRRVFAGLEGAQEGLLLLDAAGRVLGGALRDWNGADVTEAVAAYLAGVSLGAGRTAQLARFGPRAGLPGEGHLRPGHPPPTRPDALLLW